MIYYIRTSVGGWITMACVLLVPPIVMACNDQAPLDAMRDSHVSGKLWKLISISEERAVYNGIGSEGLAICFHDSTIVGKAYSISTRRDGNTFMADYRMSDRDSIGINNIVSTKKGTEEGSRYWEILGILEASVKVEAGPESLIIRGGNATSSLHFENSKVVSDCEKALRQSL